MNSKKTKIVCTIGPSTSDLDMLIRLIETGMDAARLNFSHGSHEQHIQTIRNIREAAKITGREVAIMQDLQGPKIRVGEIEGGACFLEDGAKFIITADEMTEGNSQKVPTTFPQIVQDVQPGKPLLLDDGYISLMIEEVKGNDIITKVIKGGTLKSRKGIIAPGSCISAPSLSDKDLDDLKFGLENGIDMVALSFVRSEKDVYDLRMAMKIFRRQVPVVAKIERAEAYNSIESIIREADGIMVARGDLGLEMPAEEVPAIQKDIIARCNYHGKPVITATQMLESMIENPRPTRAEASDVANAVLDGTDCVMLSGETSVGKYPLDAVEYMSKIIISMEKNNHAGAHRYQRLDTVMDNIADALGKAACVIADQIEAAAIIPFTNSTFTARNIAKYRPDIPIIALTNNIETLRFLCIVRGIKPILVEEFKDKDNIFTDLGNYVKNFKHIKTGDTVVFVAGLAPYADMPDNTLKVFQV